MTRVFQLTDGRPIITIGLDRHIFQTRIDAIDGDEWHTQIAYLGEQTVQGSLIGHRAGKHTFVTDLLDLKVIKPVRPSLVQNSFHLDLKNSPIGVLALIGHLLPLHAVLYGTHSVAVH